jgi:hypothetical protein
MVDAVKKNLTEKVKSNIQCPIPWNIRMYMTVEEQN